MKKMIIIVFILICSCGVGYLGYLIFNSKNIDNVEFVGNMQTLYIVGDEIDFEDAKLKVTYKNGNIKMVDLDSSSVEINYFSTSVETHGKMDIVYKSAVIPVEYNVIQKGAYYLKNYESKEIAPTITNMSNISYKNNKYSIDNTSEIIYISGAGVCNHYSKSSGKWYLEDGKYNKNYNYSIVADTLTVNLGEERLDIKVDYLESGKMSLSAKSLTSIINSDLIKKQVIRTYEHTDEMKTNQTTATAEVRYGSNLTKQGSIQFKRGDDIQTTDNRAYIKIIQPQYSSDHQFRNIYVKINKSMISSNFDTSKVISTSTHATLSYDGKSDITMYYTVSM